MSKVTLAILLPFLILTSLAPQSVHAQENPETSPFFQESPRSFELDLSIAGGRDQGSATGEAGFLFTYHFPFDISVYLGFEGQLLEGGRWDLNQTVSVGYYPRFIPNFCAFFNFKTKFMEIEVDNSFDFHAALQPGFMYDFLFAGDWFSFGVYGYGQFPLTKEREHRDGDYLIEWRPEKRLAWGFQSEFKFKHSIFESLGISVGATHYSPWEQDDYSEIGFETMARVGFQDFLGFPFAIEGSWQHEPQREEENTFLVMLVVSIPFGGSSSENPAISNSGSYLHSNYRTRKKPIHVRREMFMQKRRRKIVKEQPAPQPQAPRINGFSHTPNPASGGDLITLQVAASDPEGGDVTISITSGAEDGGNFTGATSKTVQSGQTATFTYQSKNVTTNVTFQATVKDIQNLETSDSHTVGLNAVNVAPTIDNWVKNPATVFAGDTISIQVTASDPEGNDVTLSISSNHADGGSFTSPGTQTVASGATATFTYQTVAPTSGLSFSTEAKDPQSATDSRNDNVTVN